MRVCKLQIAAWQGMWTMLLSEEQICAPTLVGQGVSSRVAKGNRGQEGGFELG